MADWDGFLNFLMFHSWYVSLQNKKYIQYRFILRVCLEHFLCIDLPLSDGCVYLLFETP